MTPDELRKLDAEIHQEAMGIGPACWCGSVTDGYCPKTGECNRCGQKVCPHYSTDIAAAWKVVEKITTDPLWDFILVVHPHETEAIFRDANGTDFTGYADAAAEAPLAICEAALNAVRFHAKIAKGEAG